MNINIDQYEANPFLEVVGKGVVVVAVSVQGKNETTTCVESRQSAHRILYRGIFNRLSLCVLLLKLGNVFPSC